MDKALTCDCGFEARALNDVGLADEVRRHAWNVHGMALSHDQALLVVFRGELDGLPTTPRHQPTRVDKEER